MPGKNSKAAKSSDEAKENTQESGVQNREDLELMNAAVAEYGKLKRQMRQCKTDLKTWQRCVKKKIDMQNKEIQLLQVEKMASESKLQAIKQGHKTPAILYKLIDRYRQVHYRYTETVEELQESRNHLKQMLDEYQQERWSKYRQPQEAACEQTADQVEDKLDQVVKKYNHILATNAELRSQLEKLMSERQGFVNKCKHHEQKRNRIKATVDNLYEETSTTFKEREEFRLKLNLLKERLEKTRTQSQRELREYHRMLNNDEKLNCFLEKKNQVRFNLDQVAPGQLQQVSQDEIAQQMIEEWQSVLDNQLGHSDFAALVDQYSHNLEQGYVLYGLIAQKNQEIENIDKDLGQQQIQRQQQVQQDRRESLAVGSQRSQRSSIVATEENKVLPYTITTFLDNFQKILTAVDLQFNVTHVAPNSNSPGIISPINFAI